MTEARFLLDSNICIYLLEALSEPSRRAVERYEPGEVVTSAVAYAEVFRGVDFDNPKAVSDTVSFFEAIPVLPFDGRAAEAYSKLPFERHRFDHLIAAHALSRNLTLVTRNTRHFRNVPHLRVENWTAE